MNNADTDYDQIETNLLCVSSDYRIIKNDAEQYVLVSEYLALACERVAK